MRVRKTDGNKREAHVLLESYQALCSRISALTQGLLWATNGPTSPRAGTAADASKHRVCAQEKHKPRDYKPHGFSEAKAPGTIGMSGPCRLRRTGQGKLTWQETRNVKLGGAMSDTPCVPSRAMMSGSAMSDTLCVPSRAKRCELYYAWHEPQRLNTCRSNRRNGNRHWGLNPNMKRQTRNEDTVWLRELYFA